MLNRIRNVLYIGTRVIASRSNLISFFVILPRRYVFDSWADLKFINILQVLQDRKLVFNERVFIFYLQIL